MFCEKSSKLTIRLVPNQLSTASYHRQTSGSKKYMSWPEFFNDVEHRVERRLEQTWQATAQNFIQSYR